MSRDYNGIWRDNKRGTILEIGDDMLQFCSHIHTSKCPFGKYGAFLQETVTEDGRS